MTRRSMMVIACALALLPARMASQGTATDATAVQEWLKGYDPAFLAKDLDKLATFYHPDVTIYEGTGINNGWADYRDRHLGPELKAFSNLQFGHTETKVTMMPGGQSAYATSRYTIKARMGERDLDSEGLETLMLARMPDGAWKIRHSHTSSRPRRPAQNNGFVSRDAVVIASGAEVTDGGFTVFAVANTGERLRLTGRAPQRSRLASGDSPRR